MKTFDPSKGLMPYQAGMIALSAEIERLHRELAEEKRRSFHHGEIVFRGFGYNVGSQFGIDSLKRAIRKAEFGE